jgi:hypothetical protein
MNVHIVAFAIFFVPVQFLWSVWDLHSRAVCVLAHLTAFTGYPHPIFLSEGKFKRGQCGVQYSYWKCFLTNCHITGDSYTISVKHYRLPHYACLQTTCQGWSDWMNSKHEVYRQSLHGKRQAKDFLQTPSAKTVGELLNLSRNQLRIVMGLLSGSCHFKGHLLKLGWLIVSGVTHVNMYLKWPCMFFVTVRHWQY